MKQTKFSMLLVALLCTTASWAQTNVGTDTELRNAITDNANIKLTADIDLSNSTLEIVGGTTVTIDLGGYKLDRKLTQRGENGGQVITVRKDATLNLSNGTLKGGWGGDGGGLLNEGGTANLTNVTITGCTGEDRAGGISNKGTLTMTGGAITNNISQDKTAPRGGGGLFNEEGATATLTGVTISGNKTTEFPGGGICNHGGATLTLDGCTITGNITGSQGGGIWQEGTLYIQGANTITGNTNSTSLADNLYLTSGKLLTVSGALTGSSISINMDTPGVFTSGYSTHNSGIDPATFFHSEVPEAMAVTLDGNEVKLDNSLPEGDVYYIDVNVDSYKNIVREVKILHSGEYTLLEGSHEDTDLFAAGTYVVKGHCFYDGMAYISSDTKIILCDGAKLEIEGSIRLTTTGIQLDVYGQTLNTGVLQNNANITHAADNTPGIGSDYDTRVTMNFHGGTIKAQGESGLAGISGGLADSDESQINFFDANVEAKGGTYGPGIGTWKAANSMTDVEINIYGGVVKAWGGADGAGIGGGDEGYGVSVYVYGGEVYAWGGDDGAGIGSGHGRSGGFLKVFNGIVKAWGGGNDAGIGSGSRKIFSESTSGGTVVVHGGEVYAYGGVDAAGIGGGEDSHGGSFHITGGYVYAEGNDWGAGIGGGQDGDGGYVTIDGGTVIAKAGRNETGCRAIGPGEDSDDYGTLEIGDKVMVTAERKAAAAERHDMCWYRTQVRLEACDHSSGFTYTVDGTTAEDHHISHCQYCNYSDTEQHTFENGACTVCGVQATAYDVKLYMPKAQSNSPFDGETYGLTTTHLVVPNAAFRLPMATLHVPGLKFIGWEATTAPTEDTYTSSYTTPTENLYAVGSEYTVTGNICFVARYSSADIYLYDDLHNGETINESNGKTVSSVTLSDRTLYRDGRWNTLCLPFDVDSFDGSPLNGATVKTLESTAFDNASGTLTLNFSDNVTSIEAGKPYIVKWETSQENITDPVFNNVTISTSLHPVATTTTGTAPEGTVVTFAGAYSPLFIGLENKSLLYMGPDNKLYYPDEAMTIGSCRAHFRLQGITAGDLPANAIFMNFDDGEATGMRPTPNPSLYGGEWYDLSGRKLSGKPIQKGVYINNGVLVVIK